MSEIQKQKDKNNEPQSQHHKNDQETIQNNISKEHLHENQVNNLKQKILEIKKNISDTKLREQAEIQNINKNSQKKIKKIINTQLENFCQNLIPIIDTLKKIQKNIDDINIQNHNMIKGIPLILKSLLDITEKFGLRIEGKKGKLFDSLLHTTLSDKKLTDIHEYYITEIIQDGYLLKNKVIRKAIVKIEQKKSNNT